MGFSNYILANNNNNNNNNVIENDEMERGWRNNMSPACPRCGSSNTKFCYYNNYSLTQPRYFCKGCRRYWTKGGSLRNVPVGGGCRKTRRSRSSSSSSSSSLRLPTSSSSSHHHHHHHHQHGIRAMPMHDNHHHNQHQHHHHHGNMINNTSTTTSCDTPTIDLAIVYSNFLNQKPQNNNNNNNNPQALPQVDLSTIIPDATTIAPTFVDYCSNNNNNNNNNDSLLLSSFSQPIPIMPDLIMNINHHHHIDDHHNDDEQVLFVIDDHHHGSHPHHHHHDELNGLPPLPGGESFMSNHQPMMTWSVSDLDHDHYHHHQEHHDSNNLEGQIKGIQDMESSDAEFSNLFNNNNNNNNNGGSWSPLDLPGFETSSFSSKPSC